LAVTWVNTDTEDSRPREKRRPGGLAVAEVSPALAAEVEGNRPRSVGDVELVGRLFVELHSNKIAELIRVHY